MATGGAVKTEDSPVASFWEKAGNSALELLSAAALARVDYEYREPVAKNAEVDDVKSQRAPTGVLLKPGESVSNLFSNPAVLLVGVFVAVVAAVYIAKKV